MDAASGARRAQPVIEVREVSKEYGSLRALDRVSFTVSLARVVGVLGPNGAGKTTLLGCVVGLVRPSSGQVLLAGWPPQAPPGRPERVGLLPERPGLHPRLSPWTQLRWWTSILGLGGEAARPLLELVGLEHVANRPTRRLSLGESGSAWGWPAPWPGTPRCPSSTSRPPASTRPAARPPDPFGS